MRLDAHPHAANLSSHTGTLLPLRAKTLAQTGQPPCTPLPPAVLTPVMQAVLVLVGKMSQGVC